MKRSGKKISYLRVPFARNSFFCLGAGLLSLFLGAVAIWLSISNAGQGGPNTGAFGFSSIVASAVGIWYGILSFMEKERKYILARIGIGLEVVLFIVWAVIILVGILK